MLRIFGFGLGLIFLAGCAYQQSAEEYRPTYEDCRYVGLDRGIDDLFNWITLALPLDHTIKVYVAGTDPSGESVNENVDYARGAFHIMDKDYYPGFFMYFNSLNARTNKMVPGKPGFDRSKLPVAFLAYCPAR